MCISFTFADGLDNYECDSSWLVLAHEEERLAECLWLHSVCLMRSQGTSKASCVGPGGSCAPRWPRWRTRPASGNRPGWTLVRRLSL